jgi:two-component system chemotaxis sensor kinase CheA
VAGATILGDGRVALIMDVDGLVQRSLSAATAAAALAEAA